MRKTPDNESRLEILKRAYEGLQEAIKNPTGDDIVDLENLGQYHEVGTALYEEERREARGFPSGS